MNILEYAVAKKLAGGGSGSGSGGGGGGEIPTCTVRFVDGGGSSYTHYHYTKCVDGVISTETVRNGSGDFEADFDITIENVVCSSIIYFNWSPEMFKEILPVFEGSNTARQLLFYDGIVLESPIFLAPAEADSVCTVTFNDMGGGGWM